MARIPPLKKLKPSNLTLENVMRFTNQFFNDIVYILNKRLTVNDNLDGEMRTIELDGNFPLTFQSTRPLPPAGIWPLKLERKDKAATALSAGFIIEWSYEDGKVSIINTPGLTSSAANTYKLTIISLVG